MASIETERTASERGLGGENSRAWWVADLLILPGTRQLFRDGVEITLPGLSYDLLLALVRAAPNLLTQDDLLEQVWPGLIVSPETVTQRVKLLREALGDDSRAPRYIGLVRGRGYRLLAPVNAVDPAQPDRTAPPAPEPRRTGLARSWRAWAPGGILLLVAAAWFAQRGAGSPTDVGASRADAPSVAVLPFASLTHDSPDQDWFAAGLHDELLTRLAQIGGLKVISRSSVLEYRDTPRNLRDIARELGVSTLLDGSVQQVGDRVRINAQLIEAVNQTHLWAETYDRELTVANLLDIQAEIARAIAGALRIRLQPGSDLALADTATDNLDAYRHYFEYINDRRRWLEEGRPEFLLVAEDHLRQALSLDPGFALAHASLGRLLAEIYWQRVRPRTAALLEQARSEAERALELAPGLAEAHLALALYHYYGFRDYDVALEEVALAEQVVPGTFDVYFVKASLMRRLGRLDDFAEAARQMYELSPRGRTEQSFLGDALIRQGKLDEARLYFQGILDREPYHPSAARSIALVQYLETGDIAALLDMLRQDVNKEPHLAWEVAWAAGDMTLAEAALQQMSRDNSLGSDVPPFTLLLGLTRLRSGDSATGNAELQWLRRQLETELSTPQPVNPHNSHMSLALTLAALGEFDAAIAAGRRALDALPLEQDRFQGARLLLEMALVYAQAGESGLALECLERSLAEPFVPYPPLWASDPRLDSLRGQPRFEALVARHVPTSGVGVDSDPGY